MITISSFNIQNNAHEYQLHKTEEIIKYLKNYHIDILGIQELFPECKKDLQKQLKKIKYNIYGEYRYHINWLPKLKEATPVITNKKVTYNRTYHLPYLPSLLRRIVTKIKIQDEEMGDITIINTHLDHLFDTSKKRQLKRLLKIIDKEKLPIILMGDFNLKINKEIFTEFIKELEKRNIKRIPIFEKTWKSSKYNRAIDHIFISDKFKIADAKVIKNLSMSDHYPVIVTITQMNLEKI